jgi:hypothetical protein
MLFDRVVTRLRRFLNRNCTTNKKLTKRNKFRFPESKLLTSAQPNAVSSTEQVLRNVTPSAIFFTQPTEAG